MLGSAPMLLEADGVGLAFSGDVGRPGRPIIRDPDTLPPVDYLIMESTYRDRLRDEEGTVIGKLAGVVYRHIRDLRRCARVAPLEEQCGRCVEHSFDYRLSGCEHVGA
jgi:hypothetical protein